MLKSIKSTITWIIDTSKSRSGVGLISITIGFFIGAVYPYKLYQLSEESRIKDSNKVIKLEQDKKELYEMVIESDRRCFEKIRDIRELFDSMQEDMLSTRKTIEKTRIKAERALDRQEETLNVVKKLTHQ